MQVAASEVLDFWFAEANAAHWFAADAPFDAQIRERFADTVNAAARGVLDDWATTPAGWLALLIVLDQFSRNLYRRDARVWAQDAKALRLARAGIERGDDQQLPLRQRVFAYLPLEHAEDMAMQQQSVALFERLRADAPAEQWQHCDGFLDYARRHAAVIAQFGRFPHRNAVLGRGTTPQEVLYLAQPSAGFG